MNKWLQIGTISALLVLAGVIYFSSLAMGQGYRLASQFPRDPNGIALESYFHHQVVVYQLVANVESGNHLQFSQPVYLVGIYNPGPADIFVDFDASATALDWLVPAGSVFWVRRQCRTVHAYSTGTPVVRIMGLW